MLITVAVALADKVVITVIVVVLVVVLTVLVTVVGAIVHVTRSGGAVTVKDLAEIGNREEQKAWASGRGAAAEARTPPAPLHDVA